MSNMPTREELVEDMARAVYKIIPCSYQKRQPTTMTKPAYEVVYAEFTWEECLEDNHLKEQPERCLEIANAALDALLARLPDKWSIPKDGDYTQAVIEVLRFHKQLLSYRR